MAKYRVFYLKDELSRRFRDLPAATARKQLKAKDYTLAGEIEAANDYAAWQALQAPEAALPDAKLRPFAVGDVLEREEGKPLLCLFGGFEEAAWWTPEQAETPPAAGEAQDAAAGDATSAPGA